MKLLDARVGNIGTMSRPYAKIQTATVWLLVATSAVIVSAAAACGGARDERTHVAGPATPVAAATPVVSAPPTPADAGNAAVITKLNDACIDNQSSEACFALAVIYGEKSDSRYDVSRAEAFANRGHQLQREACRAGDGNACHIVVIAAKLALPKAPEGERPVHLAMFFEYGQLGCKAGDYGLCLDVAAEWYKLNDADYRRKATELTTFTCDHDFQEGCVTLALLLTQEPTTQVNATRAAQLLGHACDAGNGEGCGALAVLHLRGAVPGIGAARKLAQRSCDLHNAAGCAVLGHCLLEGIGGAPDRAAAIIALKTACKTGEARGCQQLTILGER